MFQIPKAPQMPVQAASMTNAQRMQQLQQLAKMPVAVQRVSVFLVFLPFILMGVIGAGVFFAVKKAGGISGVFSGSKLWAGTPPALTDLDGDGTVDVIGVSRYVQDGDRAHFAAYSGKTGEQLWESDKVGNYSDVSQNQFGAIGDTLYVTTKEGKLVARNAKNKAVVKWEVSLGEKIDAMCAVGNQLSVVTADQKWWLIDGNGKKRAGKKLYRLDRDYTNNEAKAKFEQAGGEAGDVCIQLGWNHRTPAGVIALQGWGDIANIEGMRINLLIKRPGGPSIALGYKQPGTNVPMLARIGARPEPTPMPKKGYRTSDEQKALLPSSTWKAEIPAVDPLNSRVDEEHVTLNDKAVFVLYQISSSKHHLAAFDIASGKRLWDREITHGSGFVAVSLSVIGDAVALTTWQSLTAYATSDGSDRWRVGNAN